MKGGICLLLLVGSLMVVTARTTGKSLVPRPDIEFLLDNECDTPECEVLPPPPPDEEEPSMELFDLLSRGAEYLANYTDVTEAVVLLGNTGAGKSTTTQILAANLSKLHSVLTSGCNPVIIDEDNKIGLPSTKSKTLFPELFFKPGLHPNSSSLPIYDYPGFDDTRGDVEDIAANFFMNQVTGKITNLKMLFLVIHSSVKFEERKDFDLLATHAATFVKNLDKYKDSFALIVSKVANFNSMGKYIEDRTIISGIVEFLNKYLQDLQSKLYTNTADDDEITRRKVLFVETILHQDPDSGNYTKIWFVRSPLECGPLDKQEMMLDTKSNITNVIDLLEYTRVDTSVDFGFTLKSETKLTLANYTRSINSVISTSVQNITQFMQNNFFVFENLVDINNLNFTQLNETMYAKGSDIKVNMDFVETSLTDSIELSTSMKALWAILNYNLPNEFLSYMRWQEEYLSFFDKATEQQQDRDIQNWIKPLITFRDVFFNHLDWYEFCETLDSTVTSFEFQSKRDNLPSNSSDRNWLDYIEEKNILSVSRQIKDISQTIPPKNVELLNHVMTFALDKTQIICDSALKASIVYSQFLQLNHHINLALAKCGTVSQVHLYAGHTIFLDADVTVKDLDIVLIAPILASPRQSAATLQLEGQASSVVHPEASSGTNCSGGHHGTAGSVGLSGKPGAPGGFMFGVVGHVVSQSSQYTFSVASIGGNGGKGQVGGYGGYGCKHPDEQYIKDGTNYDKKDSWTRFCGIPLTIWRVVQWGRSGYNGGNGGHGGTGGQGGLSGFVETFQLDGSEGISTTRRNGSSGLLGLGGKGGSGGATGKGYNCENSCFETTKCQSPAPDAFASEGRVPGIPGTDGLPGTSGLGSENPASPRPIIDRWVPIVKYKILYFNNTNPATSTFLSKIDGNPAIQNHFSLKALAEESLALVSVNQTDFNSIRLRDMYTSLINRMEDFSKLNYNALSNEHKKVVGMLLTSAYSILMKVDSYQNFDVIVDVSYYFTIIKMQIESFRTSEAIVAIQQSKTQFQQTLKSKVDQALGYLEDVVTPAIYDAAEGIEVQLDILEEQLVTMILDTRLSLEDCKEKLRKANDQQGFFSFLKAFSVITSIGTAFMPTPEFKTFDILVKQLQTQFSGSPNDVERLKQLVEEAERLVADLEDKRETFENQFQPLVDSLLSYFRNVSESLAAGTEVAAPQLGITKWQVLGKLKETKNSLDLFADSSINVLPLSYSFDKIFDAMTMAIDLYEMIDQYMETQNLASYMATITSATLNPVPIVDPQLAHTVANFEMKLKENLLDVEVNKAMHAFRQWVFPFAKLYFGGQDIQGYIPDNAAEIGAEHLRRVETLNLELELYKTRIVGGQDTFIILTNFSSGLKTSKPFFTWKNEQWKPSIEDLTTGSKINFNADVRQQGLNGWEAIKFKQIEINFKLNNVTEEMQEEFDDIIEYFGVSMTHSGVSYYRFLQDYFVMTGTNQTLIYNFERDGTGKRLGTNQVYEKFMNGDYLLSPYTVWTIKLFKVEPTRKGKNLRRDVGFESLEKFVQFMDVELVGMGIYVNGKEAVDAAGGDLQLGMYYEKDERMRIEKF